MKVRITKLDIEHEVKTKGIQLDVSEPNGGDRLGDLTVTKTNLTWCPGKTHKKNGKKVSWAAFIKWIESQ